MSGREIWLTRNDRFAWVRYDTATGRVLSEMRPRARSAPTAGLLGKCSGKSVAFYVDAENTGYIIQSGTTAIHFDDSTRVRFWKTHRNTRSHLTVERDELRLELSEWTFATAADPVTDPVSSKDFLGTVHDFVTRDERRRHGLSVWSQSADPTSC